MEVLPYAQIESVKDDGVQCKVFSKKGPRAAVLKKSLASPNFYPGYFVLQWLLQGAATIGEKDPAQDFAFKDQSGK